MKILTSSLFIIIFASICFSACGGAQSHIPSVKTGKVDNANAGDKQEVYHGLPPYNVYYPPPAYWENPPEVFIQISYRDDGDMTVMLEVGKRKQYTLVKCESKNLDCFFEIEQKESGSRLIYRLDRYDGKLIRPTLLIEGKDVPLGCQFGKLATWCENSLSTKTKKHSHLRLGSG